MIQSDSYFSNGLKPPTIGIFLLREKNLLENLGIRTIFLGNDLIAGFRGFKLMEINEPQRLELSGCFFLRRPQTKKQCLWKQELWSEKTRPIAFAFRYFMLKHVSKSLRTEKKAIFLPFYPTLQERITCPTCPSNPGENHGLNGREGRMLFPKKANFPKFWSMEAEDSSSRDEQRTQQQHWKPASWNC